MKPILLAFALVAAGGCHRKTACAPGMASKLEVRNGSGALELAWKGDDLCDGQLRAVGTLEVKNGAVTLRDPAGKLRLELTNDPQSGVARGRDAEGPHLRLYRDARELRVLRADGVPLGSVVPETAKAPSSTTPPRRRSPRSRCAIATRSSPIWQAARSPT